ncbi:hypothetical protein FKM82_010707 [Ascaphus truei]
MGMYLPRAPLTKNSCGICFKYCAYIFPSLFQLKRASKCFCACAFHRVWRTENLSSIKLTAHSLSILNFIYFFAKIIKPVHLALLLGFGVPYSAIRETIIK